MFTQLVSLAYLASRTASRRVLLECGVNRAAVRLCVYTVCTVGCFFFRGYGILFDPSKTEDEELLAKRGKWVALAAKYNVGLAAVAVGFASLPAVIKKVVLGMASPEEVALNLQSVREHVPRELWAEAKQMGLIRPEIPLP